MIAQRLINEIKERRVIQTLIIYIGSFWGVLQGVDFLIEKLHIESNLVSYILITGLSIFPSATIYSWYRSSEISLKKQSYFYAPNFIIAGLILIYYSSIQEGNIAYSSERNEKSIAVLPFTDLSPEKNQEYFADGLSEELLNLLSHVPELKVMGRASSFQFKGKNLDLREIGKQLNVAKVLDGSIRKSDNSLRIKIELIDTRDGTHIWSQSFDRTLSDIFAIQDEIANSVVEALKVTLVKNASPIQTKKINPEAYNLFFQGKYLYENNVNANDKAIYWFKESIRLDSSFSLPWTYLAMCYWRQSFNADQPQFKESKKAAEMAVGLDSTSAIAIINLAEILESEFDLQGAEKKIKQALKLDPDNPYVLRNAGRFYTLLGRKEESVSYLNQALQNDPIQRTTLLYLTRAFFYAGRQKEAETTMRRYEEIGYKWFYFLYIKTLFKETDPQKELNEAKQLTDEKSRLFQLAIVNLKLGRDKESQKFVDQLIEKYQDQYAYFIALIYAFGGESEKAIKWLEKSYENKERWLLYIGVEPVFKPLHKEERFKKILQLMKFPMTPI